MKTLLSFLIIQLFIGFPVEEKTTKQTVSGTITTAGSYCGGAAPTDEMLRKVQAVRPMSGFTIYVKKGTENNVSSPIIDSTNTDGNGNYSLSLEPGSYILLQKNQLDKDVLEQYKEPTKWMRADKGCLLRWWEKGLATITVENSAIDSLNFHFQKRCFVPSNIPCLTYTGPYPP